MADEGAVTVCVRVRPLIERENAELGGKETIAWKSEKCNISQVDGTKSFTFDRVFHSEESTAEVYKEVADPIIKSAVQGYNGTIFAYGQTASGKTYTMLGTKNSPGILPMAIEDVFNRICGIPDREFLLRISYMEIHNETIRDLLCSSIRKKKPLVVREDINRNIYVEDLIEEVVVSPEQVMSWLQKGEKNRHYGETKMNARSSRSHTIFRMIIESKEKTDASNSNCDGAVMVSHLNLVDLAGSERASQTGADGIRLKEGCNINRSLFILGQVIKKLCEDQPGGFINYRDSKLTRILQNSLGGNAKTTIICTVTPVSLEETLSTLQFASTAKQMKNSPKVNEVLDDDALLKRYRREIEDLKRRLEEVSSDFHTRNEEKDQLAQLLEEKNSLQNQQQDRIRTLAEMVVTSSSFQQEQELKARKKRRVTWAPGQIKHDREIFSEDFPERAKRFKASLSALSEMEESVSSVFSEYDDHCLAVSATVPEEEWIPGSEISLTHKDFADSVSLCETLAAERDTAVTKQKATQAELETLQLEKEQLSQEVRELTEKIETNEFMVLEKETVQEHEMQLMHEISNLKAVIANAEGYNQDLQDDLKSKELQIKERENKITALEKQIIELNNLLEESRKKGAGNKDTSPVENSSEAMDEMKRSLNDAEIVAMDAKKESAFLRSENLSLKEKMDQMLDDYNQMKKDVECYRSQLEAGKVMYKRMQSDLQKELQYYFQENTKLTSLLEGKVPEGNQSSVEWDEKILQLKNELNKALEENNCLRKEVAALSESSLKPDLETLHREILEKSETITSLTLERETLLSQVAEKEQRLLEITDALKSKEDFASAEAVRENDEAVQDLKHQCHELQQQLATVSEEKERMQGQIENLSSENLKLNAAISEMVEELSSKVQELQAKDREQEKLVCMEEELSHFRQELNKMEQLKDQLKAWESKVEAGEVERLAIVQQLQGREEEISALAQERDELKQTLEAVQRERDQIKDDIEETVAMNIEAQNELRNSQTSLKQCQKDIQELQATVLKKESQIANIKETLQTTVNEQKLQISKLTEDLEQATLEKNQLSAREALLEEKEIQLMREQIFCLEEEKTKLQQQLETLQEEKDLSQESHQLKLTSHIQGLQTKGVQEEELIGVKEELVQALQKLSEMGEQLKASESKMEADKMAVVQELCNREEALKSLIQERDHLKHERDALQQEKDQVQEELKATQSVLSNKIQELQDKEKEQEEFLQMRKEEHSGEAQQNQSEIDHLKALESKLEAKEIEKLEMAERFQEGEEERKSLTLERDDLKQKWDAVLMEKEKLKELLKDTTLKLSSKIQELETVEGELLKMKEQLCGETQQNQSEIEGLTEQLRTLESKLEAKEREKLEMAERLQDVDMERRSLVLERDHLKQKWDMVQIENDKLKNLLETTPSKLTSDVEGLQARNTEEKELLIVKEELNQALQKLSEMEELREQLKASECRMEAEKMAASQKLLEYEEARRSLVQERDDLRHQQDALQLERNPVQEEWASKIQELQAEARELLQTKEQLCGEARENRYEMEQLTEQLRTLESKIKATEGEKLEMAERLQDAEEERKSLILERDNLKQKWDALQIETEKHKELLEETTAKLASSVQASQARNTEEGELLIVKEELSHALQKLSEMEELREQLKASKCRMEADKMAAAQELHEHEEARRALVQERDDLRHQRDALQLERDQVQEEMMATQSMLSSKIQELQAEARELLQTKEQLCGEAQESRNEMEQLTEQLRTLESKIKVTEGAKLEMAERLQDAEEERKSLVLERDDLKQKRDALQIETEKLKELLEETSAQLASSIQASQARNAEEGELLVVKEELSQALQKLSEMEELREQLKASECRMEADKMAAAQELHEHEEARRALVQERDDLRHQRDALQLERDQVQEEMVATQSMLSSKIQELQAAARELLQTKEQLCGEAQESRNEMEQLTEQLRTLESKIKVTEGAKLEMAERLQDAEEERKSLVLERDDLKQKRDALQIETEKLKELLEETSAQIQELHAEARELLQTKEQLCGEAQENHSEMQRLTEQLRTLESKLEAKEREKLEMANRLQDGDEERKSLVLERDDLKQKWDALQIETEKLKEVLEETTIKFSKTNAKLEQDLNELRQQLEKATQEKTPESKEQDDLERLQAKATKIKEALQKLPMIEKRYEYLGRVALDLKNEVNTQKELATKFLGDGSGEKAKLIRRLQMDHERVTISLYRLLNKVQFLSTRLCKKKGEYYMNISNYTMEQLSERRKQHELITQIKSLKETCRNSHAAVSQQLHIPELSQNLDFYVEQIWKDVSQMDEEVHSIEEMLQQLESNSRKAKGYPVPLDVQDFETGITQDRDRLFPAGRFLKPKAQALTEAREELESRNADYCKETEATLKTCKERTRELLQELNTLKEQEVPSIQADRMLDEENYRLESKLKGQDQEMQGLKLKIQELENAANGAQENLLEKERRIAVLEMELKVRASRSEVVHLRAALEEKENCLTRTLTENQTLKGQLNKGAELYKEEIEDLKMQLAKADMTLTKQSKFFDREMANAKALAEHRDEQLRKLREDLRRAQLEQDATIITSQDVPQPPLSITCGGGSGIVQNTQMLVLKSERAKLEREVGELKKERELMLKNKLHLKEEVKKWKERALKMKEQFRGMSEEQKLKSPRKTAPPSLMAELPSSPSKECSLQPALAMDTSSVLNFPTTFFDNSRLETFNDVKLASGESTEMASSDDRLKQWMAKANREGTPGCKTQ